MTAKGMVDLTNAKILSFTYNDEPEPEPEVAEADRQWTNRLIRHMMDAGEYAADLADKGNVPAYQDVAARQVERRVRQLTKHHGSGLTAETKHAFWTHIAAVAMLQLMELEGVEDAAEPEQQRQREGVGPAPTEEQLPAPGPSNIIVRTPNPLPAPTSVKDQ